MLKFSPEKLKKLSHVPVQSNVKKVSQLTLNFSEAKAEEKKMIYANKSRRGKMGEVKTHIERRSNTKRLCRC